MRFLKVLTQKEELISAHICEWKSCTKCPLHHTALTHVLFDIVPPNAERLDVLMIGEGPGNFENVKGKPFVGPAGKVLRTAVNQAYISGLNYGFTNAVSCRPTDHHGGKNRPPSESEMEKCMPRIMELIQIYNPRCILLLGLVARDNVGPFLKANGYRGLICNTYHPSYILRNGGERYRKWDEYVAKFREIFREARSRP